MVYIPQKERNLTITDRYHELMIEVFRSAIRDCHAYYATDFERQESYNWLESEGQNFLFLFCSLTVRDEDYQKMLQQIREKEGREHLINTNFKTGGHNVLHFRKKDVQ